MFEVKDLSVSFQRDGEAFCVLDNLSLSIPSGQFFVLLGKSGCGKTTLLRTLGGFLKPDSGSIQIDGKTVTTPSKERVMVFQSFDQLFPWFTLEENLLYALKKCDISKSEGKTIAKECLAMTGLSGFENQYPSALSGGMKQRGALARALSLKPSILLMDEPFSSLDYLTRQSIQSLVRELTKKTGCTVLLVTHDIEEAITLGDRIGILDKTTKKISSFYLPSEHTKKELHECLIKELA